MFTEGVILYFDPFYFKSGHTSKPKYFIVIKIIEDNVILASLPSSKDYVPAYQTITHGCIELHEASFNCYVFMGGEAVTVNGWAFPLNTFLYGQQLDEYDMKNLQDIYPVKGLDYEVIGQLTDLEFDKVKHCFRTSAAVKRRYKRLLNS
jgi:hypothetical protein